MITLLVLMLEEQPLVREPEPERHKVVRESDMDGMESRPAASQPSVCPSSLFNDPKHLNRAHLSSLPHAHSQSHTHTHTLSYLLYLPPLYKLFNKAYCLKSNLIRNQVVHSRMLLSQ